MSVDEQDSRKEGGVPNSFGNALAWKWTRQMPRGLKGGFLTMLYALRAMAAASGELRFKDGKPIRIQDWPRPQDAASTTRADTWTRAYVRAWCLSTVSGVAERPRGTPSPAMFCGRTGSLPRTT